MPLRSRKAPGGFPLGNLQGATKRRQSSANDEARMGSSGAGTAQAARRAKRCFGRKLKPVGIGFRLDRPALAYLKKLGSSICNFTVNENHYQ